MPDPIETVRADCPNCAGSRIADVVARHSETETYAGYGSFGFLWDIVKCRGCERVFFMSHNDDPETFGDPEFHPKIPIRKPPDWLNRGLEDVLAGDTDWKDRLRDFYGCLNAGLLVPAAVAARTAFDIATIELGADPNLGFAKRLDQLANEGHVSLRERDNLTALVEAGSAAAHRGWSPTMDELQMIAGILEAFMERTFVQGDAPDRMLDRIPPRR